MREKPTQPTPTSIQRGGWGDDSDPEFLEGYQLGWDQAEDFIERHPAGMPWAVIESDDPDPENEYERGQREGWEARIREEADDDKPSIRGVE
jgi:hypothetical protein